MSLKIGLVATRTLQMLLLGSLLLGGAPTWASTFSINRLQARLNDDHTYSLTQSSFLRWSNKTFLLQTLNSDRDPREDSHATRFELFVGRPVGNGELGWVTRAQKWNGEQGVYSAGLQLNFNEIEGLDDGMGSLGLRSFVQFFIRSDVQHLGRYDLLHYYDLNIPPWNINLRGNNIFYFGEHHLIAQLWFDAIYPLADEVDIYYRWNHLNRTNRLLGIRGSTSSIGIRFNF
ncbi:hypothetical protein KUV44_10520 [Marinobacter daepoensis]|uniref:Copper resistance protein B n=1 Tax=Marinobacter daepoensis TaxID=262077 RepID=A0ABS3BEV2_9GAMM|nr:hypothetical protein [Marinobacter daepoensis]MBN7770126.1 hypothetical protein [Marinobacter daepoensis]MBY6079572.1 hypothetical protein [Marinobacter daepoensis]